MKRIKNRKGFTLIELLAAVVILGVLMLVAIPRVSKYIDNSKRDTFVDTAKAYIENARYKVLNGEYNCEDGQVLDFTKLEVDKGTKSPFGLEITKASSYVKVEKRDGEYIFSVFMTDGQHYIGTASAAGFVEENSLKGTKDVKDGSKTLTETPELCTKPEA